MADNMRWFKVWTTLLSDYFLEDIPLEDIGRFALLGCLICKKGSNGKYTMDSDALFKLLKFTEISENFAKSFNVSFMQNDNGTISVSFKNWHKYQKDSTGYKRLKEWRKKQNDNGVDNANDNGDKTKTKTKTKIREEKKKYGEYKRVLLTDEEYKKLVDKFGEEGTKHWIKTLDEGKELKPTQYKYQSDYLAILKWEKREQKTTTHKENTGEKHAALTRQIRELENTMKNITSESGKASYKEEIEKLKKELEQYR